jgi:cytochrome c6
MRLPLLLLIAAVLLASCGDSGSSGAENTNRPANELFAGTCGSCHTFSDAGTDGTLGPNLDELAPDKATVLAAIEEGPSSMPAGLLDGEAADSVAAYVADNAGG